LAAGAAAAEGQSAEVFSPAAQSREVVQAVDDVSFTVMKGETLGVVGSRAAANRPPRGC
jgi:ABC-type glutathione transport system ATPase component